MLIKNQFDEIQDFLIDASNMRGGFAESVVFPENKEEIAGILSKATKDKTPVTISGAGTGTVGGRVPFGGIVVSLNKLNRIKEIAKTQTGGYGIVEPAVLLTDYLKETDSRGLFYPPDPTEWSCQMGGTVATNASGARSFKYGATREFVERLEIILPTGEVLTLRRGEICANKDNKLRLKAGNREIIAPLPTYTMPPTRKHAAGYFYKPEMDAIDLFIGSEGTLGVITEIETRLLNKPEAVLSGIVFFKNKKDLLKLVAERRSISFAARNEIRNPKSEIRNRIDARVVEFFDRKSLDFIREKFPQVPENMDGAIFFEQEVTAENEDDLLAEWFDLLEKNKAETDNSWFATNETDLNKMREFRHALPVAVNEFIVRHGQKKVGTDMAVTDEEFPQMLRYYQKTLRDSGLNYVIFGHIGDNHLHVNMLPRNNEEAILARHIYGRFIAHTCITGGTISAEHGIGKLKKNYLRVMFGERYINEMIEVKRAFDPSLILGPGIMFDAS
jgi:D-lactate dehydrogenase (cytochrome)